jgi:DNA-directed RNA polymerase subunit H
MVEKLEHVLVPEHQKLSDKEKQELLERLGVTIHDLPKIGLHDPAIAHLEPKVNDIIKILRISKTSGKNEFFRGVVDE